MASVPLFDLPLAELEIYQGRNPKPADFDDFWNRGIDEVRAIEPQIELTPVPLAASFAEAFELRYTSVGGARIFAKLIRPRKIDAPTRALLMFHGYSGSSGDWHDKLGYVANGFVVAAMDCRGQGGKSEDPGGTIGTTQQGFLIRGIEDRPEKMTMRNVFLDAAMLARIVMEMPEVDPNRVGCTGASQGGGLTLACAALEPRIKRAAPWYPFLSDYKRVWELDLAVNAYAELRNYFRLFDPRHEREDAIWEKLGYIDIQHLAPRIRAEVLMGIGLSDQVTPPSSCYAAYNKISSKKRAVVYPDFGHEGLPGFGDIVYEFLSAL